MNSTFSNFQYLIRYKNLKGETKQDFVYASDATEAQSLAVEFNDELQQHPHLINAILKVKQSLYIFESYFPASNYVPLSTYIAASCAGHNELIGSIQKIVNFMYEYFVYYFQGG